MKFITLISLFFSWALACSSGGGDQRDTAGGKATVPSMDQSEESYGGSQEGQMETVEAKIIRDGRMTVNVKDIAKA